jgi:hypothetical protein
VDEPTGGQLLTGSAGPGATDWSDIVSPAPTGIIMIESGHEGKRSVESGASVASPDGVVALDRWVARKVQSIVVLYVAAVFAAFIAVSYFVFHSQEAVTALVIAAVGAIAATIPGVLEKVEYLLTASGIEKRTVNMKKPGEFKRVFQWDQLSRVVHTKRGIKYYKSMNETNPLRRFWKAHISDEFSGEIHVEKKNLERIRKIFEQRGCVTPRRTANG